MSLVPKAGHFLTVEIPGSRVMEETAAFNRDCHPGNIALFGRNLAGPGATARLIDDHQKLAVANAPTVGALCGDFRPTGNLPAGLTNAFQKV